MSVSTGSATTPGMRGDIQKQWSKFTYAEVTALKSKDDLVAKVQTKYALDKIQAPGRGGAFRSTVRLPPPRGAPRCSRFASLISMVERVGGRRWDRTSSGMAIWTATKTARVMAMAGRVRRTSIPTVTPRAKAKAA